MTSPTRLWIIPFLVFENHRSAECFDSLRPSSVKFPIVVGIRRASECHFIFMCILIPLNRFEFENDRKTFQESSNGHSYQPYFLCRGGFLAALGVDLTHRRNRRLAVVETVMQREADIERDNLILGTSVANQEVNEFIRGTLRKATHSPNIRPATRDDRVIFRIERLKVHRSHHLDLVGLEKPEKWRIKPPLSLDRFPKVAVLNPVRFSLFFSDFELKVRFSELLLICFHLLLLREPCQSREVSGSKRGASRNSGNHKCPYGSYASPPIRVEIPRIGRRRRRGGVEDKINIHMRALTEQPTAVHVES